MNIKKIVFVICILGITIKTGYTQVTVVTGTTNSLIVDFTLPAYTIQDTSLLETFGINQLYSFVDIEDFGNLTDLGYPFLPQYTIDLFVPADATTYSVSQTNVVTENVNLTRKIIPFVDAINEDTLEFTMDSAYYNSNGAQFAFQSLISDTFNIMGANGISFSIFPFQYNPLLNRIQVIKSCRFTITHNGSSSQLKNETVGDEVSDEYLHSVFENYPILKSESTNKGKYLIITAPEFENTLTYFANYKRNIGYNVTVVNTNTTGTTASAITNYITNRYNNSSTRPNFILLVGDHSHIPVSYGNTGTECYKDYNNPATDFGYTNMNDDFYADIHLGRISVEVDTQLYNILNKSIYMETNLHLLDNKASLLAGSGDNSIFFNNMFSFLTNRILEPFDFDVDQVVARRGGTQNDGIETLNSNNTLILYSGHGYPTYWGSPFIIDEENVFNASNSIFPFAYGFSCSTNAFTKSYNCIGESWILSEKGSVSYFGATTISWILENNLLMKKIFSNMNEDIRLAEMLDLGKKQYKRSFRTISRPYKQNNIIKMYNLLGDPSLYVFGIGCRDNYIFTNNEVFNVGNNITYTAKYIILQNTNTFQVKDGANVTLQAGNSIILNSGFVVEKGGLFIANKVEPCN